MEKTVEFNEREWQSLMMAISVTIEYMHGLERFDTAKTPNKFDALLSVYEKIAGEKYVYREEEENES